MLIKEELYEKIITAPTVRGAYKAAVIRTNEIVLDRAFRVMCESNACGAYGKCYMCPPDVGDADKLMEEVGQ